MNATDAAEYGASWYAATVDAVPECRVLAGDLDVEVCVVGGGVAGLTVAYELARRGWSAAVVEAERIGAGGSGSGAGIVAPGFCEPPEGIVARVGVERARRLWQLSEVGVDLVRATIGDADLADVTPTPGLLIAERDDRQDKAQREVALLRDTLGAEAEFWPTDKVRSVLRSGALHQAVHLPRAFHIHPLNYLLGLADAGRRLGVRIYEGSPVRAVDAFGIRKQVDLAGGRVRARHIVLAGSGDLGALHPTLAGTILQLAYPVGVTVPLGPALAQAVRFAGAAIGGPAAGSHRIVGGDRLMWTGALTARRTPPRRLADSIRRAILRTYPQLRGAVVEHAWYGRADYAVHRMPQIGELEPGLWLAAGFGHHGIAAGAMAGDLIASAIRTGDDRWRLFHAYGLVWTGGALGRTFVAAALGLIRLHARLRDRGGSQALPPLPDDAAVGSEGGRAAPETAQDAPRRTKKRRSRRRKADRAEAALLAKGEAHAAEIRAAEGSGPRVVTPGEGTDAPAQQDNDAAPTQSDKSDLTRPDDHRPA